MKALRAKKAPKVRKLLQPRKGRIANYQYKGTPDNSQKKEATLVQETTAPYYPRMESYRIYVAGLILLVLLVALIQCAFCAYEERAVEEHESLMGASAPMMSSELPCPSPPPPPEVPGSVEEVSETPGPLTVERPAAVEWPALKEPPAIKERVAAIDQHTEEPRTKDSETSPHPDWWTLITEAMQSTLVKEQKRKDKKAKKAKKGKKTLTPSSPAPPPPLELPTEWEAISLPSSPPKEPTAKKGKKGESASPPSQPSPPRPLTPTTKCEVISPPSSPLKIFKKKQEGKEHNKGRKGKRAPPPSLPPLRWLPELLAKYEAIELPAESRFGLTRYSTYGLDY